MQTSWNLNTGRQTTQLSTTTSIPDPVYTLIRYDAEYLVHICTDHGYAIPNLRRHLVAAHTLSKQQRRTILTIHAHEQCIEPQCFQTPPWLVDHPVPGLKPPVPAVQCLTEDCDTIFVSVDHMRQHCNKNHGWKKSTTEPTHWRQVMAQTFFVHGGFTHYFAVRAPFVPPPPPMPSLSSITASASASATVPSIATPAAQWTLLSSQQRQYVTQGLQERAQLRQAREVELRKADEEIAKQDRTGWFTHTGWPQHFAGRDIVHIAHCSRLPDKHETVLIEMVRMFDEVWRSSVDGLGTLDQETRRWLRSPQADKPDVRPLARLQTDAAIDRYAGYMRRFLCYVMRLWAGEEEARARPHVGSSSSHQHHLPNHRTDRTTSNDASDDNDQDDGDNSDDSDDDNDDNDNDNDNAEDDDGDDSHSDVDSESGSDDHATDSDASDASHVSAEHPSSHTRQARRPQFQTPQPVQIDHTEDARALFPWQAEEKAMVEQLYVYITDKSTSGLTEAEGSQLVLNICLAFIFFQQGHRDRFRSGLVHFIAVLGIDQENRRLKRAADYSYILAGMVYCVRVLAMERLMPRADREQEEEHEVVLQRFLQLRRRYMVDGSYTPMSVMISLLAYSKHVAMETGNSGSVSWSRDKTTMYYRGQPIEMISFRHMIHDILHRAEDLLWRELMWVTDASERFKVSLDTLVDDLTFSRRDYSFITRESNGLQHGFEWMLARMHGLTGERRLHIRGRWQPTRIRRYLRRLHRFWRLLAICIHTQGGQPARGTELLSIRFRNGGLQDRNVFVLDGQVAVITRYHKSQSLMDRPKIVPRFLPWRCGQLLTIYLAYVQPFQEHLRQLHEHQAWSDHIWYSDKGAWDTPELTGALQQVTQLGLGHAFGTLDYRHIAVSIGREMVHESFASGYQEEMGEVEEPEVDEENALELQSGRGEAIGSARYGVPINIVTHLTVKSLTVFRSLSDAWHQFLQLDSLHPSRARQHGHTPAVPHLLSTPSSSPSRGPKRPLTRSAAVDISTRPPLRPPPDHGDPVSAPISRAPTHPRPASSHAAVADRISQAMQQLFGPGPVTFHSPAQEEAIHAVLARESPLIVVLPTGGGKTVLAMIPALLEPHSVTIFVTPFRALTDDMVRRFRRAGIDSREWRHGDRDPATVVVVSADIAASFHFLTYAQQLQQSGLLHRIFIDESHLVFTSSDWRPKLAQLRSLRVLTCPMVLLSATLPPMLQYELEEAMAIRQARYIRASTSRAQHRYHVQNCAAGTLRDEAITLCRRWQSHIRHQRGVVYCRSQALCDDLAEVLQCLAYHAGHPTDRSARLQQWIRQGGLIVATSALGTGVDIPGILVVIHVDRPWSMIDFAQESGRAGRGGEVVDSIILVERERVHAQMAAGELSIDASAMAHMILTDGCRRWVMGEYLDGVGRGLRCVQVAEGARCDRCGEGLSTVMEHRRRVAAQWQQMEAYLDDMTTGCALCMVLDGTAHDMDAVHGTATCTRWRGLDPVGLDQFRRLIRYPTKGRSCHKCGIDQRWCQSGQDSEQTCQWPNVLVPVVRCALGNGSSGAFELVQACGYGGAADDLSAYGAWLGQPHPQRIWDLWMSNAMVVLIRVFDYLAHRDAS